MKEVWLNLSIILMICLFTLIHCRGNGSGDSGTGSSIKLSIEIPSPISTTKTSAQPTLGDIKTITIIVEGSDFSAIQDTFNFPGDIRIFVPVGENRTFRLLAFDMNGQLIFRGTAEGVTISPGENTVTIQLIPVEGKCTDGIDDDGDGLIDCADPDCNGQQCNLGGGGSGGCVNHECVLSSSPSPNAVDLSITKSDSPDPVAVGNNLTYTLMVTNNGPNDATGVTVTDTLPVGVMFVSSSPECSGTSVVTCNVGNLGKGASATEMIVVKVMTEGAIGNSADVTGNEPDPDPDNNTATSVTNASVADLSVTKTGSIDIERGDVVYTIRVTNNGPSTATGVILTDNLPSGVVEVDSVSPGSPTCNKSSRTVICNLGTIAKGITNTVTIVIAPGRKTERITNTASVRGNEPDPNTGNNTAIQSTIVVETQ